MVKQFLSKLRHSEKYVVKNDSVNSVVNKLSQPITEVLNQTNNNIGNTNSVSLNMNKNDDDDQKKGFFSCLKKKKKIKKEIAEKKKEEDGKDIATRELFRYADCFDKFLLFIGTIGALGSAGLYPLMFLMYGRVAGSFIDYSKSKYANSTTVNLSQINRCFFVSEGGTDYDERVRSNVVFYISVGIGSVVANYLASVCWSTAAERQTRTMRNLLFQKILSQEIGFFDKTTPGDINSTITSNINTIQYGIGFKVGDFISMFGRGLACLVLAMVGAWKFSVVYLGLAPLITVCTALMVIMIKKYTIEEFKAYGNAARIAQEVLSSIRTVFALGLQHKEAKHYEDNLLQAEAMSAKKGAVTGFFAGLAGFSFNAMFGIGIYYGVYLIRTDCDTYKPGLILQAFFSMITTIFSLGQALPFLKDLAEARGAAKSVYKILDKKSEIDVTENKGKMIKSFNGRLEFENVFFNYPTRAEAKILQGLDLIIPAGKTVALCGSSGGGKSTVIQLIQRFYDPLSGTVKVDGYNIRELDLKWFREQMALVSQEPVLFALTIKENIRLGRLDATDEEIIEAAKKANAHNFIMNLDDKYETYVGERGTQLSGGQKQRIAIARALIRDPKILLLDEATSALDLESEKIVQDALDRAKIGRTTIIVAHRLSTIRNADLIVAMANGKVAEMGTHNELMKLEGVYYELVMRQTKEADKKEIENLDREEEPVESDNAVVDKFDEDFSDEEDERRKSIFNSSNKLDLPKKSKCSRLPFKIQRLLWSMNKAETGYIIIGTISQMINGVSFPIVALIFCDIYSIFAMSDQNEQNRESLKTMGIIFGISGAAFVSTFFYNYAYTFAGARLTKRLRAKLFSALLRQEIGWHDLPDNRSSILTTRLSASIPLCRGLTIDWLSLISQGISGVGIAVIISLVLNWKLALVTLVFVPISFGAGIISARASLNTDIKGKTTVESSGKLTIECTENIKTLINLGREEFFYGQFKKLFKTKFKRSLGMLHLQAFFYGISNSLLFFVQATVFGYGFELVKNDGLEVKNLYRIYAINTFSAMILGRVFSQMPDKTKATNAAKAAFKIIHRIPKIDSMSDEGLKPNHVIGEVKFHDVHFKYPTRENKILRGLNLTINSNETTALVGQSGCGKSTVIQLLLRFYDVDKGKITLDGVDIRELNIKWLRAQIGLVSQEPVLFNCSIFDNICYGDVSRNDIKLDEIIDAAAQANIHSKVESLPDKYNTIVGTKGGQLSGGEKQRVAIARALIKKPKILLLDEATSALDTQSEQIVQDALDRAQIGRTCICIAHRLSTIENAPKISVFKNGRIIEEGSHEILMNNKNIYYTLQNQNVTN